MGIQRDSYWDSLKFLLIFLVVYGHVLTIDYGDGSVNRVIFNFIFLFHMPLFIFISGRFSQVHDSRKYIKGILRLLETYVVFQILHIVSRYFMHRGSFELVHLLIYPEMTMWYLQCLIFWRLLALYVLPKPEVLYLKPNGKSTAWGIVLISLILCLLAGFVPLRTQFSFQRTFSFSPFFIVGYYSASVDFKKRLTKLPLIIAYVVLAIIFIAISSFFNGNYKFLTGAVPYIVFPDLFVRCGCLFAAMVISIFVMRITPSSSIFAKWGQCTLFIYMYHLFFEAALKILVNKGYLPSGIVPIFIYSVALTMFLVWTSQFRLFNIILNPITNILSKKKNDKIHR